MTDVPASVRLLPDPEASAVSRTGAVASVQEAQVSLPREALQETWRAENLELLARSYWRFLTRISLGLLRVVYAPDSRTVVLVSRPFNLLRFDVPEYVVRSQLGQVTWRIQRGLLVAKEGRDRGYLRITIRRDGRDPVAPDRDLVGVRMEVRNFYPWLRGSGWFARFGTWFYKATQLRLHALIARGFLRSLARLDVPGRASAT